jgi:cell division protein ZapE
VGSVQVAGPPGLAGRVPGVDPGRLLAELVPPPRFAAVSFDSYLPHPEHPAQREARDRLRGLTARLDADGGGRRPWSRRRAGRPRGVYLDGGFGVGKTHLLASLFHAAPAQSKVYGTFVEYTHLAGALGFGEAVRRLSGRRLVCIDEFELDDPGDTVLMARLIRELMDAGATVAATSNTLPEALGEGRFAAEDFLREIQALSDSFDVVRIDGPDHRHRGRVTAPPPASRADVSAVAARPGGAVDDFDALLDHLAALHPSRYGALLDGVRAVGWHGARPAPDQNVALRLVVLADRLYDRGIPVVASGVPLSELFTPEMLRGGYRKKYLRATSRLTALARDGAAGA